MLNNIAVIYLGHRDVLYHQLKSIFSHLPKFASSTPVPYTKHQLYQLHQDNLTHINAFLFRNQIPTPPQISHFTLHPPNPPIPPHDISNHLSSSSPWQKLKNFLADKTKHFVIWPLSTYLQEFNIHIEDKDTYTEITSRRSTAIEKVVQRIVRRASTYFKDPNLLVSNPSPRYFFLLPKLHKPLNSWRIPYLQPKSRPIISDSRSASFKLSKKLLTYTQKLESTLTTVTHSSLTLSFLFE